MDSRPDGDSRCVIPEVPRRKAGTKKLRDRRDRFRGLIDRIYPDINPGLRSQIYKMYYRDNKYPYYSFSLGGGSRSKS